MVVLGEIVFTLYIHMIMAQTKLMNGLWKRSLSEPWNERGQTIQPCRFAPYMVRYLYPSTINIWLVALTILKNISQWEGLSHILWKFKKCLKPPTRYTLVCMYFAAGYKNVGKYFMYWAHGTTAMEHCHDWPLVHRLAIWCGYWASSPTSGSS